jgi:hypothetical protein
MNRLPRVVFAVTLSALTVATAVAFSNQKTKSPQAKAAGEPLFEPAKPVPVADKYGQIGRSAHFIAKPTDGPNEGYFASVVGTADVFGKGPYDLFVVPDKLFPFQKFDDNGSPLYGRPVDVKGLADGAVIRGPNGAVLGVFGGGKKVRVANFNKTTKTFDQLAVSPALDIPGGVGAPCAYLSPGNKFNVYFVVGDGNAYLPPGDHHSADFIPYDGAGFLAGRHSAARLVSRAVRLPQNAQAGRGDPSEGRAGRVPLQRGWHDRRQPGKGTCAGASH